MSCPNCDGELHVMIPAIDAQEPVMGCRQCGAYWQSPDLGMLLDVALDRQVIQELKAVLKAA